MSNEEVKTAKPDATLPDAIDTPSREEVAAVPDSAHPNAGGRQGGFGGETNGYRPSPEEVAEMKRIAESLNR